MASLVLSTWDHGLAANARALEVLAAGGSALDAAEAGVMVTEADASEHSVGLAGRPDASGVVTLDAAVMDHAGRAGGVGCVRGIQHPVCLARMVMERTPHVLLVGAGAEAFAAEQGVARLPDALHPDCAREYDEWRRAKLGFSVRANVENVVALAAARAHDAGGDSSQTAAGIGTLPCGASNHDTIGMLVRDTSGVFAGSCTTSGLAFKQPGRVGDSPIVGAGLYVCGEAGAAVCTGVGEVALRTCAAFLMVELMRAGASAQDACERCIARILAHPAHSNMPADFQCGVLAISAVEGPIGGAHVQFDDACLHVPSSSLMSFLSSPVVTAFSIRPGFTYALNTTMHEARSALPAVVPAREFSTLA